ncbi:chloride channel protein [Ramlibacter ginsenosidimutans]|uniref:Chloride channel protein n=1 Tax=Ramlibacter ginsenosidimutans TaxID=502333 RepID=A0A934TRL3_9BURK|nr:chloride channel protein [Ramlibacter ginsenosidimutans]MBK6006099.1 chloride channel protein [Ramlibacter ginsenosidimutans]
MHPDEAHHRQPDVLAAIRGDLANSHEWVARAIVLAFAALSGACVVGFTVLCNHASGFFNSWTQRWPWLPLVETPALCAAIVWVTVRFFPGAAGSGIPQVMVALNDSVEPAARRRFVSLRLAIAKVVLTAAGLLGGLAIGREGPSVQVAAGVMLHARRWLPRRASINPHALLVAGGAAGIAAAFNAPLAGIMFAIEELTRKIETRSSGLVIAAIVLAGLIAVSVFGNSTYFGVIRVPALDWSFAAPAVLVVLGSGLLGGFFSRLLHASLVGTSDRVSRWRAQHPVPFAAACGLGIAVVGLVSHGSTFGAGYSSTRQLLEGHADMPLLYVTLRIVATWLALWSGVPGGLFAPSLAIGAGIGADVSLMMGWGADTPALIALGMCGFLAAVTQAPMTAFIIVMEMVDGHAMVLSLMATALAASLLARWLARPLYPALAAAQLAKLQQGKAVAAAARAATPATTPTPAA